MRALFAIAAILGTTVASLMASLSGQEFARWQAWMHAERMTPEWGHLRHAELVAAMHNSGHVKHKDGRLFAARDFMPRDPWAASPALTPEEELAQQQAEFDATINAAEA